MTQRIIQIGNSTGIIIPKSLLDKLGLRPGVEIHIEEDMNTKTLTIAKKGQKIKKTSINSDFLAILDKVNKNYGPVLKKLAER